MSELNLVINNPSEEIEDHPDKMTESEFKALLDVFRTLLDWQKDYDKAKE